MHDMQCMAYESAMGRSYCRQQNYGKALKMHHETFKHFNDIAEDKFDFHNYCLRKTTLKAYVAMLRMQERLYSHKFFRRAAKDAVRIYLELHDRRARGEAAAAASGGGDAQEAEMSAADRRKLKHKKQREAKKAEAEKPPAAAGPAGKPKKVDDDPEGAKLLEKEPIEEAGKLVKTLVLHSDLEPTTHVLTYEVFSRQGRLLHCLQALLRLWQLSGCDPLHYKLVAPLAHFCFLADLEAEATPGVVREVVLSELAPVLGADNGAAFESVAALRAAASRVVDSLEQRLRETPELPLIEVLYGLQALKNAGRDCRGFLESWKPPGAFALKDCNKMIKYLADEYGKDSPIWLRFKERALAIFPLMVFT